MINYCSTQISIVVEVLFLAGRYMVATRDIEVGTVIGAETPVSSMLHPGHMSTTCYTCYTVIQEYYLPCPRCSVARFCGQVCWSRSCGDQVSSSGGPQVTKHWLECGLVSDLSPVLKQVNNVNKLQFHLHCTSLIYLDN